jgi:hypothetical protein
MRPNAVDTELTSFIDLSQSLCWISPSDEYARRSQGSISGFPTNTDPDLNASAHPALTAYAARKWSIQVPGCRLQSGRPTCLQRDIAAQQLRFTC